MKSKLWPEFCRATRYDFFRNNGQEKINWVALVVSGYAKAAFDSTLRRSSRDGGAPTLVDGLAGER